MLSDILNQIKKDKKYTLKQICEKTGLALPVVGRIFSGATKNPKYGTLAAILKAMDVPFAALDETANLSVLSTAGKLSRLSPEGQDTVQAMIDHLLDYEQKKENTAAAIQATREIPLYLLSASAGVGSYLDSDAYDFEAFPVDIIPPRTKFAIRVCGDSMEPAFYTDDLVFVYPTQIIHEGDIAILTINDEGYIKEYHEDGFYSLNPKYAPIRPSEYDEVRIIGKVVGKYRKEESY